MVWNFTCNDTFASSHFVASLNLSGKVAERAKQAKLIKYAQIEDGLGIVPVCVETMRSKRFKFCSKDWQEIFSGVR